MVCKLLRNKTSQVLVWLESLQLELLETLITEVLGQSNSYESNESVETVSLPLLYEQHVHSSRL